MFRTTMFMLVPSLALAFGGCAGGGGTAGSMAENAVNHQATEADLATTRGTQPIAADSAVLWVNGLGCPLCATNVDKQLERVKGVEKVGVDLSNGEVTLTFTPGVERPSPVRLKDAVEDAGFTLVRVQPR